MQKEPMPYSDFQRLAIVSASQYLDYLDASKKLRGVKVISVYEIQETDTSSDYIFLLSEKLSNPDFCEIWVDGFATDALEVLTTYKRTAYGYPVKIRDNGNLIENARFFSADRIKFVSDMRFLIRRLKAFYQQRTFSFSPPAPAALPPLPEELLSGLSDEQLTAVEGVFESPVSYINGAPGTGKTNMVLSRCILRYVLNKKKVILLAPTNNAIEQMLCGILPVLRSADIDLTCVYRLGTSSEEFARDYPQVVGDAATDSFLETLNNRKAKLLTELELAHSLERKCSEKESERATCKQFREMITAPVQTLTRLSSGLNKAVDEEKIADTRYRAAEEELALLLEQLQNTQNGIQAHEETISANESLLRKLAFLFWKSGDRKKLLAQTESVRGELAKLKTDHDAFAAALVISEKRLDEQKHLHKVYVKRTSEFKIQIRSLADSVLRSVSSNTRFCNALRSAITAPVISLDPLDRLMSELDSEFDSCAKETGSHPSAPIQAELEELDSQLKDIGKNAKQMQKNNALVLAGTIDASLGSLPCIHDGDSSSVVSHVFLDEAGYTSLIRGMVAFSCGAPVTFLGDHKQLSPICEMNRIDQEHAPVCLWSLSIAYFPELIYGDFYDLYIEYYCRHQEPGFRGVAFFSLNTSYRFGPGLADILAKYIYSGIFKGVGESTFEVSVIDARFLPGSFPRSNLAEAQAITKYIVQEQPQNFAILTPYNGQVRLLQQMLPRHHRDSIMTVHRAQGREWDTVIFSVADTKDKFFTDSRLPVGRRIINTAISRAKCKLVIVCDTAAWSECTDQIISDLIS